MTNTTKHENDILDQVTRDQAIREQGEENRETFRSGNLVITVQTPKVATRPNNLRSEVFREVPTSIDIQHQENA